MKTRIDLSRRLESLSNSLSLTPLQRARLTQGKAGLGSELARAHAAIAAAEENAIDDDFTAEESE